MNFLLTPLTKKGIKSTGCSNADTDHWFSMIEAPHIGIC